MKWILLLFACLSIASAQVPDGKLYLYTLPTTGNSIGDLGYIDYADQSYKQIDSANLTDMTSFEGVLYTAAIYHPTDSTHIRRYDLNSDEFLDSIPKVSPNKLSHWQNKLVFTSYRKPYFRVWDITGDSLYFSLDSARVPPSTDVWVLGDSAYVSHGNQITVIDMNLRDTVRRVTATHPWFDGWIQWGTVVQGNSYFILDYATGAVRFSLFRLSRQSLTLDSVRYVEFYPNPFPLVPAGDRIYLLYHKSHYHIPTDSLYIDPSVESVSLAYDEQEEVLMTYDQLGGQAVESWFNDTITSVVPVPQTVSVAHFVPTDELTHIRNLNRSSNSVSLYPNPAQNRIYLNFGQPTSWNHIRIIDSWGRQVLAPLKAGFGTEAQIELGGITKGIYWVQVSGEWGQHSAAFVKL